MKLKNYKNLFIFIVVFLLSSNILFVQKNVESKEKVLNKNKYDYNSVKKLVNNYFENIFNKNYEEAIKLLSNIENEEQTILKLDKWRKTFLSPNNLKIINIKENNDNTINVTLTFEYVTSNGIKDIIRDEVVITLTGKDKLLIKKHKSVSEISLTSDKFNYEKQTDNYSYNNSNLNTNVENKNNLNFNNFSNLLSLFNSSQNSDINPLELFSLINELANDPDVLALASDPKIMEISNDPQIMNILLSGNLEAIQSNPKIQELMSHPAIKKIIEKVIAKNKNINQTKFENDGN